MKEKYEEEDIQKKEKKKWKKKEKKKKKSGIPRDDTLNCRQRNLRSHLRRKIGKGRLPVAVLWSD